jgi:hypothetical protein
MSFLTSAATTRKRAQSVDELVKLPSEPDMALRVYARDASTLQARLPHAPLSRDVAEQQCPRARPLRDAHACCFIAQLPVQADKVNVVDCVLEAGKKHAMLYKVQLSDDPKDIVYRTYDDFFDFNLMLHGMVSWRCSRTYPELRTQVLFF